MQPLMPAAGQAQPFKAGFTDSMHIVFLLGVAVMVLASLVAAWTKEVPLRKVSGLEARAAAERGAAAPDPGRCSQAGQEPAVSRQRSG